MGLQLWLGNSGSGKSHNLYKRIIEEAENNPSLTYLIIVPEQFTLTTQKDILRLHPKHGILNIDILSFKRLAHRIFEEVGFKNVRGVMIDDMGKNLILRRLASQHAGELPILGANVRKLGYITEIKSALSEFMQYNIGDKELEKLIQRAENRQLLCSKLKELQLLYNVFNDYIREKYITTEELLEKVSDCIPGSQKIKTSVISFDGFTGFTPVQYKVIEALMDNCLEMNFTVLIDNNDLDDNGQIEQHELFYLSKKTIKKLKSAADDLKVEKRPDIVIDRTVPARLLLPNLTPEDQNPESLEKTEIEAMTKEVKNPKLIHLERNLFRKTTKPYEGEDSDDLRVCSCLNRIDEITGIAVEINRMVRDNNWSYRDIAVVTGDIDLYMHVCARVFDRYDIPYFIDRSIPILLNPLTEYIRAAISCVGENYPYPSIMRYLRSSLTKLSPEETDRLDNYLLAFGIRGRGPMNSPFIRRGKGISEEELEGIEKSRKAVMEDFIRFETDLTREGETETEGESETEGKPETGGKLLISSGDTFSVRRLCEALYALLKRNDTAGKLSRMAEEKKKAGEELKEKELTQIYDRVMELLDQLTALLGEENVTLKEFGELLDAGFSEIRTGVVPKNQDYVQIGDMTRSRLRNIKALFVAGVNDGIIPKTAARGGLISDVDREFLSENEDDIDLAPSLRMQAYTQRLYLYMMLSRASEKLFLSYPGISDSGESLKPSYLIKIICEMFPKLQIDHNGQRPADRIVNGKTAYRTLAEEIQGFSANYGKKGENPAEIDEIKYLLLFNMCILNNTPALPDPGSFPFVEAAFGKGIFSRQSTINRAIANVIYNGGIVGGITRLEKYAACAYSHFLTYGLRLKEREGFTFGARNLGSAFHEALKSYGELLAAIDKSWTDIDEEERRRLVDEAVDKTISSGDYTAIYADNRSSYIRERIRRFTQRSVEVLTGQLKAGSFKPNRYEFDFNRDNEYRSLNFELPGLNGARLSLRGTIDRFDTCEDEDNIYLKIVDYKSGNKSFDLKRIYEGLDLQLPVYLNAASEFIAGDPENAGKALIPAGIFYYHIDDPLVREQADDDTERIRERISGELRMKGLVNEDRRVCQLMDKSLDVQTHPRSDVIPVSLKKDNTFRADSSTATTQEFRIICDYVNHRLVSMGEEILNGNIGAEPHGEKNEDPCRYCGYKNICAIRLRTSDRKDADEEDEASRSESEGASGKEIIEMMKGNDPIQKADRRGRELGK